MLSLSSTYVSSEPSAAPFVYLIDFIVWIINRELWIAIWMEWKNPNIAVHDIINKLTFSDGFSRLNSLCFHYYLLLMSFKKQFAVLGEST